MSELRIGIIAEGKTDFTLIEKIAKSVLHSHEIVFTKISPTEDELLGVQPKTEGFGWKSVYFACHNLINRVEMLRETENMFDAILIHLDGDVSQSTYSAANIEYEGENALPCYDCNCSVGENCEKLKEIILNWIDSAVDFKIVFCIPYISTAVWAAYLLYENDRESILENTSAEQLNSYLLQKGKSEGRLIRKKQGNIKKINDGFEVAAEKISLEVWKNMIEVFEQAKNFNLELISLSS